MNAAELSMADQIVSHQIDLMRLDAGMRNRILALLDTLGSEIERKLHDSGLTEFQRARFNSLISQIGEVVDSYYTMIHSESEHVLHRVIEMEANPVLMIGFDGNLPTQKTLTTMMKDTIVQGAPSADWWAKQSEDAKFKFTAAIRSGLTQGDTASVIAQDIRDTLDVSKANAESLVRTSIAEVANDARFEMYKENDDVVSGVRQLSTLDGRTSEICIAYSDGEWDLDGNPINDTDLDFDGGPPRHWNCRSVLVPILNTDALGFDISGRGSSSRSADGESVNDSMSFDAWFDRRTAQQQDEQLGAGKAQLWRDGKITLRDLLNQRGNPLTLDQLQRKASRGSR